MFQGCGKPTLGRAKRSISPKMLLAPSAAAVQELRAHSTPEADTLDIDATLDEAIVLRERRAAEPGLQDSSAQQSQEQGVASGNGGGNRRQQQRRKQQRRKQQQQNNRNDNDDDDGDSNGGSREPILDKIVRDIRQRVKDYKKFWSNLPHSMCSNEDIATSSDVDGMCWNGHTIDR